MGRIWEEYKRLKKSTKPYRRGLGDIEKIGKDIVGSKAGKGVQKWIKSQKGKKPIKL
jgi:hypothetical protein